METIVIDIQAKYEDKTAEGYKRTAQQADKLGTSIEKTKKQLDKFGSTTANARMGVIDKATASIEKTKATLQNLIKKPWQMTVSIIDKVTAPLRGLYNFATSIRGVLTGIMVGKVGQTLISKPVGLSDQIESAKIFFENKLGSVEASNKMLRDIFKFDEKSPFDTMQIIDITQQMMGRGWDVKNVLKDIGTIGDASASLGKGTEGVEGIARALSEVRMKGKVSAEEMNQLATWGIGGWGYMTEAFKKTRPQLEKEFEKGAISSEQAVDAIIKGMERDYGGAAAEMSDRTIKGIFGQVSSLIQTKVALPWGEGLATGAKKGLGIFKELLEKNSENITEIGEKLGTFGEEISTGIADFATEGFEKIKTILDDPQFKEASLAGKFGIVWDKVIAEPFSAWWESSGRETFGKVMKSVGSFIGEGVVEGLKTAAGAAFSNPVTGGIATAYLGTKLLGGAGTVTKAIGGVASFGGAAGTAIDVGVAAKGAGTALAAGSGAAAIPLATVAGVVLGGAGVVSSAMDFKKAGETYNDNTKEKASGISKLALVGTGAAIGTAILPGIGSAIGAGIGGLGALIGGSHIGEAIGGWIDGTGKMEKSAEAIKEASVVYEAAKDTLKDTTKAVDDYRDANVELERKSRAGLVTDEDIKKAKDTQKQSIETLQEMYPGLISQYDIENGKLGDKLRLIEEIAKAEDKKKTAELESTVMEGRKNFSGIEEKIHSSNEKQDTWQKKAGDLYKLLPEIMGLEADFSAFRTARSSGALSAEEETKMSEELYERAGKLNAKSGDKFSISNFESGYASKATKEEIDKLNASTEKEKTSASGWVAQYEELYKGETALIDNDYGGGLQSDLGRYALLNGQVKLFKDGDMTGEQLAVKKEFDELSQKLDPVIAKIQDLNDKMGLIPTEKKINIDLLVSNHESSVFENKLAMEESRRSALARHANGGIITSPHIGLVGEAGAEAIIPLTQSRRGRGLELWQEAGRALGVTAHADGGIFGSGSSPASNAGAPTITLGGINIDISGGGDPQSIMEAIREKMPDIANELCEYLAKELGRIYSNMPVVTR